MHGTVHREGGSFRRLRKSSSQQHMRSVPPLATGEYSVDGVRDHNRCSLSPSSIETTATSDSFFKDGRKIRIGDCALFKPPQDSPPFIGLIRWLTLSKDSSLQLGVNWLYRPAELNLGKGSLVEGAPNEIFYSFHKDRIPAASLLHPCKVAFLPRGVDLPAGTSSFVCRRVYDIANKCLWWLTDQDYFNERQEEVDQLLLKTRTEMHAKLQPGGRSPKQVNGPTSTSQLKPASDSGQNSGNTLHSQVKGKKRERGDHSSDPVKRERCIRTDDGDSLQCKAESNLKYEIARITEKGVVDLEAVEKLVLLIQQDRTERKMDLVSRSMLAGVMASTDQVDCLNRFVQLQGIPILDEWLQDIHKGKIGDGNSLKNSDKSVEEFLLVILRVLDKLPVNLHALEMCNIGKSVNHLRSHKNVEIQRKARSLVDTWKKRVVKHQIARITEKGVVDLEGVEKLVQLIQEDRTERKIDLVSRSMLAGVMASTDQVDCLNRFVQLQGIPVLDEWLQDIHKGKIGDGNSLKNSDKSVEEFLLVLLCALDKLPVNLHALQMCNIGRSVNHLRSHKNIEIQRKARSLVDTWKKRVEAEMNNLDAKSGSTQAVSAWPSKSRLPEASHGGNRAPNGSDVAMKSSITQNSASKTTSVMSSHGENNIKSATSPSSGKQASPPSSGKQASPHSSGKESQPRVSVVGAPDVPLVREDRSSSSNQSHNCSLSSSGKEEGKITTSASVSVNKMSSSTPRNRKNSGFSSTSVIGSQKEIKAHKNTASEKLSQSAVSNEGPIVEGISHKLIVKIPNRVRSPAQAVGGASLEDSTYTNSRISSPVLSDKREQFERISEDKSDMHRSNAASDINDESWKNNGSKDVTTRSAEGTRSPAAIPDEEQSMTTEVSRRLIEGAPTKQLKSVKLQASSFSPMNALVESCAKYSEANTSLSLEDDVGMNLLASVAAGEMSRSDLVSPTDSTERSIPAVEEVCNDDEAKSKSSAESDDRKPDQFQAAEDIIAGDKHMDSSSTDVKSNFDDKGEVSEKCKEKISCTSVALPKSDEIHEEKATLSNFTDGGTSIFKSGGVDMGTEEKGKPNVEVAAMSQLCEGDSKKDANEGLKVGSNLQHKPTSSVSKSESVDGANLQLTADVCNTIAKHGNEVKVEETDENDSRRCGSKTERLNNGTEIDRRAAGESHSVAGLDSTSNDLKSHQKEASLENKEVLGHISVPEREPESASFQQDDVHSAVAEASSSAAGTSDVDTKIEFDLNEGFSVDEVKYAEPLSLLSSDTTLKMINSLSYSMNSVPNSHSASITVAAAAKGPFVPPEDLLKSKVELGWKGSAATSAFRPAEPRKAIESPLGSNSVSCPDSSTSKPGRMLLDFDLNVPDERVLEEMATRDSALAVDSTTDSTPVRGFNGLDLDLNRIDEANDNGICSTSSNRKGESSVMHIKPLGGLPTGRDFDLNDGPGVDDANVEHFPINQQMKAAAIASRLPPAGFRMNNPALGNFSSWLPPGNAYPTVAIPTMLPDRGEQQPFPVFPSNAQQRTFGPSGVTQFTPDIYRGSVLSSSPAMPFPSSPFQFPVFPFGTTYPLPSATFPVGATSYADASPGPRLFAPPVHPHLLGPVGSVASQYQRPYLVGMPDNSNNGLLENPRKWGREGLDLNAGPGAMETEVREEILPLSSGQHFVGSSQALAEEQARMFSVSGGLLKRKEPEGGWENDSFRYNKQSSWQ